MDRQTKSWIVKLNHFSTLFQTFHFRAMSAPKRSLVSSKTPNVRKQQRSTKRASPSAKDSTNKGLKRMSIIKHVFYNFTRHSWNVSKVRHVNTHTHTGYSERRDDLHFVLQEYRRMHGSKGLTDDLVDMNVNVNTSYTLCHPRIYKTYIPYGYFRHKNVTSRFRQVMCVRPCQSTAPSTNISHCHATPLG